MNTTKKTYIVDKIKEITLKLMFKGLTQFEKDMLKRQLNSYKTYLMLEY